MTIRSMALALVVGIFVLSACMAHALGEARTEGITRSEASMQIDLGYGIVINKNSSLRRQIVTIHDTTEGAVLVGEASVFVNYIAKKYRGEFTYEAPLTVLAKVDLRAIEIRFLMFDLWGNAQRTLSATKIKDIKAGTRQEFTSKWRVWNENDATYHNASIAYIAQLRTADGRIWKADVERVVEEASRFTESFKRDQLNPTRPPDARK